MQIPMLLLVMMIAGHARAAVAQTLTPTTREDCDVRSTKIGPAPYQASVDAARPTAHEHIQDLVAMLIAVCSVFCTLLAFVILKQPVPRLHDTIPREVLGWSHCDNVNLFVFTDLETDSIMIKNAGFIDIDLSRCKLRVEHARDRGIYYNFSFPDGYLLVAGTTVSVCYRTAAKFVSVPRRQVDRLDSRTCPRLRWPPHNDGPVDSSLDSASLFDRHGHQIACESAVLQAARVSALTGRHGSRRGSTDSSDAAFFAHLDPVAPIPADWY